MDGSPASKDDRFDMIIVEIYLDSLLQQQTCERGVLL
jgi:hypothetical protein